MSRNRQVRGPRSALTSFLEERGIRNTNPAPRLAQVQEATPNTGTDVSNDTEPVAPVDIVASDGIVEVETEDQQLVDVAIPTRRSSRIASTSKAGSNKKENTKENKKGSGKKKARGRNNRKAANSSDSEYYASSDASYNPKARFSTSKKNDASTGGVSFCSLCNRRFVVLANTLKLDGRLVCALCEKDPPQKNASIPKLLNSRQTKKRRRQNTLKADADWFDSETLPSLQSFCIQVVCDHIDSVDSFGDLSAKTMTQISRILSKHRRLDDATLSLFLAKSTNTLSLFDCARLCEDSLCKLADFGNNLTELKLQFCGRMNDEILTLLGRNLPSLTHFTLHGAFLVTELGFLGFLSSAGAKLKWLTLQYLPRFANKAMESLVTHCLGLQRLAISYCEKLNDGMIKMLVKDDSTPALPFLEALDLSYPGPGASDESLIKALPIIGSALHTINLAGWKSLSDDTIVCGIKEGCPKLSSLDLSLAEKLTTDGLSNLLNGLAQLPEGSGLSELNLSGCSILLDASVLSTLLSKHYRTLTKLSISGLDGFTGSGIEEAFAKYPPRHLVELDVSWVRSMSDPLLAQILPLLPSLDVLRVWGCHKVTETLVLPPRGPACREYYGTIPMDIRVPETPLKIVGRECDTL